MVAVDSSDLWAQRRKHVMWSLHTRTNAGRQNSDVGCRLADAVYELRCCVLLRFWCAGSPM